MSGTVFLLPIDNPVLAHPTARVEFQLDLTVTALVSTARGEDFHDQLGCRMEMSRLVHGAGQTIAADPDHIRRHIVIVGKNHAGRYGTAPATVCGMAAMIQREPRRHSG